MSWFILEGPDDTGKTTLARVLEKRGWMYQHAGELDRLPFLAQRLALCQDEPNVVWDRCHLGEVVHNLVDRHQPTPEGWRRLIEAFLLERRSVNVLMTDWHYHVENPENDIHRQRHLTNEFQAAASGSLLYWHRELPALPDYPDEWSGRWSRVGLDPEGLGSDEPLVWVLGEQQNQNAIVPWPFASRCGIELVWPVVDPRDVRVSNAFTSWWRQTDVRSDPEDLHERWERLGKPPVIALGVKTAKLCSLADIAIDTALPHPQYWLRFHAKEPEVFQYWLRSAITRIEAQRLEVQA